VCKACGNSYHIDYKKPAKEGVCDACGGELIQRADDAPETVLERLRVYHEQTEPLKAYYAAQGKVVTVLGQERVEDTTALTLKALEDQA
jgi:adenylate kinase